MEPAPADLFERLARGEDGSLDEVCRRYGPRVARIARTRLGKALRSRMETADIAQESLIEIVRDAPRRRFASEEAFLRWVKIVVERRIYEAARRWKAARRGRGVSDSPLDRDPGIDPWAERPSEVIGREETLGEISTALAGLPPGDREVIVSRLLLGIPWDAVARSLAMTVDAAQMRLVRARRRLAVNLAASGCRPGS